MQCHGQSQLYLADLSCIWLILIEALMHYYTRLGCYLEVLLKGGGIQQLDHPDEDADMPHSMAPQCLTPGGKVSLFPVGDMGTIPF